MRSYVLRLAAAAERLARATRAANVGDLLRGIQLIAIASTRKLATSTSRRCGSCGRWPWGGVAELGAARRGFIVRHAIEGAIATAVTTLAQLLDLRLKPDLSFELRAMAAGRCVARAPATNVLQIETCDGPSRQRWRF